MHPAVPVMAMRWNLLYACLPCVFTGQPEEALAAVTTDGTAQHLGDQAHELQTPPGFSDQEHEDIGVSGATT